MEFAGDRLAVAPRLSVVTVVRNAAADLEATLASIAAQDEPALESVVVDGASNDGTFDVVRKHRRIIGRAVSEPDSGIYDAMNKGLAMARGEIVQFLNAGDLYHETVAARTALAAMDATRADVVVGDSIFFRGTRRRRRSGRRHGLLDCFVRSWNHQAVFMRTDAARRLGGFDTTLRTFSDQDLLLRARAAGLRFHHLPEPVVEFRFGDRDYGKDLAEKLTVVRRHGRPWHVGAVRALAAGARVARRAKLYDF